MPRWHVLDIERGSCNDWYLVTCGDRLTPDEINPLDDHQSTEYNKKPTTTAPVTTEVPTTPKPFVCPSSEGFFPHERNCGKYYLCINNQPEVRICPKGQLYDIDKKRCNDEEETNCGKRIHPNGKKSNFRKKKVQAI
ncbi:uncharacterized protein TNCT_333271 [Trichonephila clavata]|uniref:Chitin-binding type-2 domain-containing protein n=1 Tax=Trichonephila clavata TaxID=2740835 RepID=A0A8X6GUB1_TRICU|nr:uncharacterized protein TNCT_333271 [Trichonephila clavata]